MHEHDVLLQDAHQPHGMRQMAVFSSLRYKPKDRSDTDRIKRFIEYYKFAGLAVTPYTPRLGSEGFQQGQGFVATFTGLNVVRVADDVIWYVGPRPFHKFIIASVVATFSWLSRR